MHLAPSRDHCTGGKFGGNDKIIAYHIVYVAMVYYHLPKAVQGSYLKIHEYIYCAY